MKYIFVLLLFAQVCFGQYSGGGGGVTTEDLTAISNAFVTADALKINKINGTATDLYIINELNFTNVSYGTTASIGSMESGYFKYIHNTAVEFLSPFQFNFSTNVYISGNLGVVQIPTAGTGVGNRDYNDARYAGIAYTSSVLRVAINGTTNTPTDGLVNLGSTTTNLTTSSGIFSGFYFTQTDATNWSFSGYCADSNYFGRVECEDGTTNIYISGNN